MVVTATATPGPLALAAITPATAVNDAPTVLTITGTSFLPGMHVSVGGQTLTNVQVQSATVLTGTLPSGLCPGTYPASISSAASATGVAGAKATGGALVVTGVHTLTVGASVPSPSLTIGGKAKEVAMSLNSLTVTDTTCATDDYGIVFSQVTAYTQTATGRTPLTLGTITLEKPSTAHAARARLDVSGEHTAAATAIDTTVTTLHISRTGAQGTTVLLPTVTLLIDANTTAGRYVISLEVTLAQ